MPFGSIWRPHRRLTIGALIIILLVLGYGLVRTLTPDAPTTMTPVPVQEPFRLTRTVTLRPAHTQAVSSPVSGLIDGDVPVAGVVVREGDRRRFRRGRCIRRTGRDGNGADGLPASCADDGAYRHGLRRSGRSAD